MPKMREGGQKTLNFEIAAGFKMDLKIPSDFFIIFRCFEKDGVE